MNNMERKIGEIFDDKGKTLEVVENSNYICSKIKLLSEKEFYNKIIMHYEKA